MSHSLEECLEFTRSDRYAAMMLVWRSYNFLALEHTSYYQRIVSLEKEGGCCGFGPPTRCTVREQSYRAAVNSVGYCSSLPHRGGAKLSKRIATVPFPALHARIISPPDPKKDSAVKVAGRVLIEVNRRPGFD